MCVVFVTNVNAEFHNNNCNTYFKVKCIKFGISVHFL